jgi:hypothetical protein
MKETPRPPKPPFDPLWGAWVLLLALVLGVIANAMLIFVGCAIFHEPTICARSGDNLRDVTLELITAIAVLVSQKR